MELKQVLITDIDRGDRFREDFGDLNLLLQSVKDEGLITPIALVEVRDHDKPYKLLAGERRLVVCEKLGWDKIAARIYDEDLERVDERAIELAENIFRKALSWDEEITLKDELHKLMISKHGGAKGQARTEGGVEGWTQEKTARLIGEDRSTLSKDLQLAAAVRVIPDLAKAQTKKEAWKVVEKLGMDIYRKETAEKLQKASDATPTERLKQKLVDSFIISKFEDGVKQLPNESISLIEMDPPYGVDIKNKKKHEGNIDTALAEYEEVPQEIYMERMDGWLRECYRVLAPDGWLLLWFGIDPWFDPVWRLMQEIGFKVKGIPGIWAKGSGQTQQPGMYLANSYEPFFYARKSNSSKLVRQGRNNVFVFRPVTPKKKIHPTEKPIEMMQELLTIFCEPGANVLVPFAGSGNTLLAASNLNMTAIGFDLAKEYKDGYTVRVFEGEPGSYCSY